MSILPVWTPDEIRALRERLRLDPSGFAKLLGVDARTVARWEAGLAAPTGAAEAVMTGLREKLDKDPGEAEQIIKFIVGAVAVGGLAYLLIKLLDEIFDESD